MGTNRLAMDKTEHDMMVRYILKDLTEEERTGLEESYFADDTLFETLVAVEDELVDEYARGELTGRRRELFEKNYLTSDDRRERVEFARALTRSVIKRKARSLEGAKEPPARSATWLASIKSFFQSPSPALKLGFAAAMLAALFAASWLVVENLRLRAEVGQLAAEREGLRKQEQELQQQIANERARVDQLAGQIKQEEPPTSVEPRPAPQAPPSVASFVLSPLTREASGARRFVVPADAAQVEIKADFESAARHTSYRAAITTAEGTQLWRREGLRARASASGKTVILRLPSRMLKAGDLIVTISGLTSAGEYEDVADYSFTVLKK
jgi:hypothetical protein